MRSTASPRTISSPAARPWWATTSRRTPLPWTISRTTISPWASSRPTCSGRTSCSPAWRTSPGPRTTTWSGSSPCGTTSSSATATTATRGRRRSRTPSTGPLWSAISASSTSSPSSSRTTASPMSRILRSTGTCLRAWTSGWPPTALSGAGPRCWRTSRCPLWPCWSWAWGRGSAGRCCPPPACP